MTGLCVVGALLALVVKRGSPETALLLAVGAAVVVALALAGVVEELLAFLEELAAGSGVPPDLFTPLYKTIGSDTDAAVDFVEWCAKFAENNAMEITMTISADPATAPEALKKYL